MRLPILDRTCVPTFAVFSWLVRALLVVALSFTITSTQAFAQASPTGTVEGRVQNAKNGQYLNNARVRVEGTDLQVFTNQYGEYTLNDVPAGQAKLQVLFTGLPAQTVTVNVAAGQTVQQDLFIGRAETGAPRPEGEPIVLDQFVIQSERETNAQAIAANEQRFAPNIKVVVSSDAFGDVTEGNIGEFVKYLPGITVDYVAADVRTMSVRGFSDNFTNVYFDGARLASASSGNAQRSFEFEQVSINNVARIEVVKVPTPEYAADTLGGSVNMIGKTAFERDRAQLKFRAYGSVNNEDLTFWNKTPGPQNRNTYKVLPGFDFDLTLPITKTFGIVVTGLTSNQFNEQHRTQMGWNFAQAGAAPDRPYLQTYTMQDGPKNSYRNSGSIRADWKIAPGHSVFVSLQSNYYKSQFGNRNLNWDTGTAATSSTAGGQALSWSPIFTNGATGRGSVRHGTSFRDKLGETNAAQFGYRFNGHLWDIDAGLHGSTSRSWYRDSKNGHFSEIRTTMNGVSRVSYLQIKEPRPESIVVYNANAGIMDPTILANYRLDTARTQPVDGKDKFTGAFLNVKRELDFLPFNAAIKTGVVFRQQKRDITKKDITYSYVGPDGTAASSDDNAANYLDTKYGADPYWGFSHIQWPDPFAIYDAFKSHPSYFNLTTASALNAERFRLQNSQSLKEDTSAAYIQGEMKFLQNKLNIVTGVRFENTKDSGQGLLVKGKGSTLAEVAANWKERGLHTSQSYDGYYPSFSANYNITDNLVARFAYALTYGRPDFSNILPLARVNDTEQEFNDGIGTIPAHTIIANNTGLKPWTARNYDFSLEYYMPKGGVLSGGYFYKDLKDFWGKQNVTATADMLDAMNLDTAYVGYQIQTTINSGDAAIKGVEFNYQQPLTFLPGWGRNFSVFANGTKLWLSGSRQADFSRFIEQSASWGVTFSRSPLVVMLKWNYRGEQKRDAQTGSAYGSSTGFYEYYRARTFFDVNVEYALTKRFTLFANARNIMNVPQTLERYNYLSPEYSHFYNQEKYGVQMAVGVKGTF